MDGGPIVDSHHDRIAGAEDLGTEVVADRIVSSSGDHHREPVVHRQHHRRGVDVTLAAVRLPGPHRAGREHLLDLATGQPPRHVEVVDVQIDEDPAAGRDVALIGGLVVVSAHPQRVQVPTRACGNEFPRSAKAGIEPAHERDLKLDAGIPDQLDRRLGVGDVDRDRLLAEHRQPSLRPGGDVLGMLRGDG